MIELFFYDDLNFCGMTKKSFLVVQQAKEQSKENKKQRDPQLHVFPQILKEKKHDNLFSKVRSH